MAWNLAGSVYGLTSPQREKKQIEGRDGSHPSKVSADDRNNLMKSNFSGTVVGVTSAP